MDSNLDFQVIDNPLGFETGWSQHLGICVGVHKKYTFNSIPVHGLIEIIVMSEDDCDEHSVEPFTDFRDMEGDGSSLVTTAQGARKLAEALNAAAEKADAVAAEKDNTNG